MRLNTVVHIDNLPLHALDDAVNLSSLDGRLFLDQLDKVTRNDIKKVHLF